jgi:hypothetical protein
LGGLALGEAEDKMTQSACQPEGKKLNPLVQGSEGPAGPAKKRPVITLLAGFVFSIPQNTKVNRGDG